MIAAARRDHPGLDFRLGDLLDYDPRQDRPDAIVSNAAFQWVAGHEHRFPDWIAALPSGGVLAFQIPDNFDQPAHTLLAQLRQSPRWKATLGHVDRPAVPTPADYLQQLTDLGCAVDVWETTYHQILTAEDAVVDWMRGTGLRPALDALPDDQARADFLADYRALTAQAYPAHPWGTVLPYHRVFVVAVKK
jgi:trans-aconitate 2-methyltransferase